MKKQLFIYLLLTSLVLITIPSCKKYVEGPKFSLLTKKARLTGEWVLESYSVAGVDETDSQKALLGANFVWEIEKDGKYMMRGNISQDGAWKLGEDKDDIRFTPDGSPSVTVSYRILRLSSKELWLRYTNPLGEYEITKLKQE